MNDERIPLEDDIYEEEIEVEEETAVMNAMWGNISGNIENQTDLQQALDAKQDNLTQAQLDAVNSGITSAKVATYDGYPAQITSAVSSEADIRRQDDTTLQSNIDAEERARKAADKDIQDVVDGETLARQNADNALGGRIDTEIHDRQVADNGLQSQIDAITSKSDVVDVVANYAALQTYDTSTLGNNDVVKVLDDETHGDAMTYYRWSTTTQTWSYIGQEAPYYTKSQTDTLLLDKQDKIDATHKLSADLVDDTSTTNKFVTAEDKTTWNAKQDALTAGNNINIEDGAISTPAIAPEVVAELPATGAEGKLYLTPKNYTRSTATGNPITATVAEDAGTIESFQLDGDTEQQTYTGKNLLGLGTAPSTQGLTVSLDTQNNSITYSGTATGAWAHLSDRSGLNIPSGTYTVSVKNAVGYSFALRMYRDDGTYPTGIGSFIAAGSNSATFTIGFDCHRVLILYNIPTGTTAPETTIEDIMLEAGSSVTSFEPYVGGTASPNPDYPQPIQTVTGEQTVTVVGKNLFNKDALTNGCYLDSSGAMVTGFPWAVSEYMPVKAGQKYTISGTGLAGTAPKSCFYDSRKTFVSSFANGNQTITIPSGVSFMRASVFTGNSGTPSDLPTYMLELGESATAYAPYHATTYPINLGKNLFDKDNAVILTGELNADKTYSTDSGKTIYIECKPNTTYSVQKADIGNRARLGTSTGYLPNGGTATNYAAIVTVASGKRYGRITSGQNDRFLWFTFARDDDAEEIITRVINSIQIEAGAQHSSYTPYKTPIELCKLGTYQDYIWKDGEDWKIHKATASYQITGQESDLQINTSQTNTARFFSNTALKATGAAPGGNSALVLCNRLERDTTIWSTDVVGIYANQAAIVGRMDKTVIGTTVEAARSYFANNPTLICYQLATATDTVITDAALIAQLEAVRTASLENGTNTITNTATGSNLAGDMEIGYYGYNPTNRYDKFIWLDLNNNYEQIGG